MTWIPIDDKERPAPRDGTRIWVHNGRHYGIAEWFVHSPEPDTFRKWNGSGFDELPNPRAGEQSASWFVDWATSEDHDYNNSYEGPEPTHWMPLPPPPEEGGE